MCSSYSIAANCATALSLERVIGCFFYQSSQGLRSPGGSTEPEKMIARRSQGPWFDQDSFWDLTQSSLLPARAIKAVGRVPNSFAKRGLPVQKLCRTKHFRPVVENFETPKSRIGNLTIISHLANSASSVPLFRADFFGTAATR